MKSTPKRHSIVLKRLRQRRLTRTLHWLTFAVWVLGIPTDYLQAATHPPAEPFHSANRKLSSTSSAPPTTKSPIGGNNTLDDDNDGLSDFLENRLHTAPTNPDSDGDGITDGDEVYLTLSSPVDFDTGSNGESDFVQLQRRIPSLQPALEKTVPLIRQRPTDPDPNVFQSWRNPFDSDGDGMTDVYEAVHSLNALDPYDGADDPDGDFLTNLEESQAYSNPKRKLTPGLEKVRLPVRTTSGAISGYRAAVSDYEAAMRRPLPGKKEGRPLRRGNGPRGEREWDDDWDWDGKSNFVELYYTQTELRSISENGEGEPSSLNGEGEPTSPEPVPSEPTTPEPTPPEPTPPAPTTTEPAPPEPTTPPELTPPEPNPPAVNPPEPIPPSPTSSLNQEPDQDPDQDPDESPVQHPQSNPQPEPDQGGSLEIDTETLISGLVGAEYNAAVEATGGTPPYAFSTTSSPFPEGLIFAPDGTLSGTPTKEGDFSLDIMVTDSEGETNTKTLNLHIGDDDGGEPNSSPNDGGEQPTQTPIAFNTFYLTAGAFVVKHRGTYGADIAGNGSGMLQPLPGTSITHSVLDPEGAIAPDNPGWDTLFTPPQEGDPTPSTLSARAWLYVNDQTDASSVPNEPNHTIRRPDAIKFSLWIWNPVTFESQEIKSTTIPYPEKELGAVMLKHTFEDEPLPADVLEALPSELTASEHIQFFLHPVIRAEVVYEDTSDNPLPMLLDVYEREIGDVNLSPLEFEINPSAETLVNADSHSLRLSTVELHCDSLPIMEAEVGWRLTQGQGTGNLSDSTGTSTLDEPEVETTLVTTSAPGDTYEVEAYIKSITTGEEDDPETWKTYSLNDVVTSKSGTITVVPGTVSSMTYSVTQSTGPGGAYSMPPDGHSTRLIEAQFSDMFGNPATAGVPVHWNILEGDGHLEDVVSETDGNGRATALLRSGRIGDLPIQVAVRTDTCAQEIGFAQPSYTGQTFSLSATQLAQAGAQHAFNVTASVSAANGTPISWQTTRGWLSGSTTVQGGQATVTVTVDPADLGQLAVITATVGRSNCLLSKSLTLTGTPNSTTVFDFVLKTPNHVSSPATLAFASGTPQGVDVYLSGNTGTPFLMPAAVTTDSQGRVLGQMVLPNADFPIEQIRLELRDTTGQPIPGTKCLLTPRSAGDAGDVGPDPASTLSEKARTIAEASSELHSDAYYVNIPEGEVSAEESAEFTRASIAIAHDLFDPPSPGDPAEYTAADVGLLAPPALGGTLEQQAAKAPSLLDLVTAIDGICADAKTLAQELDTISIEAGPGAQIAKVHVSYSTWDLFKAAWPSGAQALEQGWADTKQAAIDCLLSAGSDSLIAAAKAAKSFNSWEEMEYIGAKIGVLPLIQDAHQLVETLDEEAFTNLVHAMARYAGALAKDPGATALATIQTADPWIASKINAWAQQGDESSHVIAAAAGMTAQMLQNGTLLASAAGDPVKAFKRMAGQMLGTVISASLGSQEAQDELKEMVPFYSWLLLGEKIDEKWSQADYYGAGKEAWNITLQIAGDVTIFLPIIKGAAAGIKFVGQQLKVVFQQGTKKQGQTFTRKVTNAIADVPGEVKKRIGECADGLNCFPAGTLVLMADGSTKPIEQIAAGDLVLSDDPTDNTPPVAREVTQTLTNWTQSLTELQTDQDRDGRADGSLHVTPNHLMWTARQGWMEAGEIREGDELLAASGAAITVSSSAAYNHTCPTYNLCVSDNHSFFVLAGNTPVLTHNTNVVPRAWVIYQVVEEFTVNGVTKMYTYTGKASMPSDTKDFDPTDVLKRRYSRTRGEFRRKTDFGILIKSAEEIKIVHEFWDDGTSLTNLSSSTGRLKTRGEVIAQALEAFHEFEWRLEGQSLNKIKPLRGERVDFDDILDFGQNYLETRNNGSPCAGLIRIR